MQATVVASFNVHGGVDGYGRPFDVVAACQALDADVIVMQETWSPDVGGSLVGRVGDALGYRVEELAMARARIWAPPASEAVSSPWGPILRSAAPYGLRVGEPRPRRVPQSTATATTTATEGAGGQRTREEGTWGMAVLSRLPLRMASVIDLGQLRHDPARRGAIVVEADIGGRVLRVIGTHLAHLTNGSILQLRSLLRLVGDPEMPSVLAGDMNMWGPPLSALLPGWRRVVRGRTWPAWRPLAQLDHILVTPGVARIGPGQVMAVSGSDHLPVRARLTLV
jgi:endonuclease/exonuclease/phosphatase family metal-dependent hydrolase